LSDLFTNPQWRRNTLVGLGLAVAGQIGLWGVGFYTPELIDSAIPTVELQTRPKIETILNATSTEAHSSAVAALDEAQKRKYADLVLRISPARDRREIADLLANPLNGELREQMRSMLAKAIPEDQKTHLKMWGGILQQIGAFFGISCFTLLAARRGRRLSFLV